MHRQAEGIRQRHHHAAARRAIQLGHHQAGDIHHLAEGLDLGVGVLAGGGVEHKHGGMRGGRVHLGDDPDHLLQLVHQHGLVVQPAGGVDQQHVGAFRLRPLQRVEGQRGGIAILRPGDHRTAGPLAPDFQLLHGGGAEGIAGGQHHLLLLVAELFGQLADGRGLAGAVHADHQHDMRLQRRVDGQRQRHGRQNFRDILGESLPHLLRRHFLFEAFAGQVGGQLRRCLHAEIGLDQQVFQLLQRGIVQLALGEQPDDAAAQLRRGAGQPLL